MTHSIDLTRPDRSPRLFGRLRPTRMPSTPSHETPLPRMSPWS